MPVPHNSNFVLSEPLASVPAGATGRTLRLDAYHVTLAFDNYEDLVFDVADTDSEVWASITTVVSPSKSGHTAGFWHRLAIAASVSLAFGTGWLVVPQPIIARVAVVYVMRLLHTG